GHVQEFGVGLHAPWIRALRNCKVRVIENGPYRTQSVRGWLHTYGWFTILAFEVFLFQAVLLWWVATHRQGNPAAFVHLWIPGLGLFNLTIFGAAYLFKLARERAEESPN